MKILIWLMVTIVLVGGLVWFFSSDTDTTSTVEDDNTEVDQLSENGRVIDSDEKVMEEIDEAMTDIE